MPRLSIAAATVLALLVPASPALAGDPTMPLSEVRSGMRCTGWSVVRGTEPVSFDVEVDDVIDGDPTLDGARILVAVSGPNVDRTGIGPGFEIEMDIRRVGPIGASLYLTGGGYYIYSDRKIAFSVDRTIGPDPVGDPVTYHADFSFRVDPWLYRAGLGFRFAWLGNVE